MGSLSYSGFLTSQRGMPSSNFSLATNTSEISNTVHLFIGSYLITIGVLSIIGNLTLLILLLVFPRLRSPTSFLLASLASVDIGMALFGFPFSASSSFAQRWLFGYLGCQWYGFNGLLFGFSSIGMLTVISIDRYLCVVKRDRDESELYKIYSILVTAVIVNALLWAVMPIVGWGRYGLEPSGSACTIAWWHNDWSYVTYVIAVFMACFLFPICVMMYCYIRVIRFVRLVGGGGRQENLEWTNEKEIVKMSAICVILFVFTWTPYAVVCLWTVFASPASIPPLLSIMPGLFAKSSAFVNPFIYAATNRRIRHSLLALFKRKKGDNAIDSVQMVRVPNTRC